MLKKNLLIILLTSIVVGGVTVKTSIIFYEHSATVNQSKASYKEGLEHNIELSIPNSDISKEIQSNTTLESENSNSTITKDSQISDTSLIESPSSNISETSLIESTSSNVSDNGQTNVISKSSNSNDTQNSVSSANLNSTESSDTITEVDENASTFVSKTNYPTLYYDRTTSIYDDDAVTLLRVEYYLNNKLTYYSVVEQFDATTNSYVEKIFQWDYEKNIEILICTNIYANGKLINSY